MNCTECDAGLSVPTDAMKGEIISCKDCGTSYELMRDEGSGQFSIRPAELEEEDWGE
ncbi:MAG: lysine biosynthesis protein LysW [Thaumarchaeota archaeon]|nr:lysine biosynthesis protein LysW [Nitrososphaerota archaeon]MCS4539294.1 lysine biosynthesis protein LysW [Nitrososphaerota archaeon]